MPHALHDGPQKQVVFAGTKQLHQALFHRLQQTTVVPVVAACNYL